VKRKSFDSPYDLQAPAGAEGWQELYPYNLVFRDNLRDKEDNKFWFCDSQHWPNVFKPFETVGVEFAVRCLGAYNTRHYIIPPANGIEFRIHNGYCYMSPVGVAPELIPDRVPHFLQRAGHYFQNWDSLLENWKKKVHATIEEMDTIEFSALPEMVDFSVVESGAGIDPTAKMMADYDRLIQLAYQNWEYHFEFLNLGYVAYLDFFMFCKESFPGIPDLAIAKMVMGVDSVLFRPDDELKTLAMMAANLGLADVFASNDGADAIIGALNQSEKGREWVTAWNNAQNPWFNYTSGNGFYGSDVYWRDHLDLPMGYVQDYVRRAAVGEQLHRPKDALIVERDRITEEYSEFLSGDALSTFQGKLGLARTVYPYVEDHNFYIEHWTMGVFWRKVRQLSRVLHGYGFWNQPDDMLYLTRDEVRPVLFDLATGWGVGADCIAPSYWPEEIERRRKIVDALSTARPEPAFNEPPAEINEPFTIMLWGITTEQVSQWLGGDNDDPNLLKGMAASPGVVEGRAKIITGPEQLDQLEDGDILVAPVTAPSWGPVFGKIKATVTDIGGMMSHAAIVCREYGLPAVTGTGSASTKIKTGMMIRVDGSNGTVEIIG
jgi:pyruvate,water dikinase